MDRRCGYSSSLPTGFLLTLLVVWALSISAPVPGLSQQPFSASAVEYGGLDLKPSNPRSTPVGFGAPGAGSILVTPQMFQGILPLPSNLQAGYLFNFGDSVGSGRLTLDFIQPIVFGNSAVFGEAHGEFQNLWKTIGNLFRTGATTSQDSFNVRTDLSFGAGYRTILREATLLGVNGFFDTTKLGGRWYSSGSVGLEMVALLPGNDALDLNFNWYGNLFNSNVLADAFRRGPENYDFQAGYSHELWNGGPDLRLSATGYCFSSGSVVYGGRTGAELMTRDGMFSVKYEAAHDPINQTYHTVGGFVNVGFQLSNLLSGASPFVSPTPVFKSPRNLARLLSTQVKRSYYQPSAVTLRRASQNGYAPILVTQTFGSTAQWQGPSTSEFLGLVPDLTRYSFVDISWTGVATNLTSQFQLDDGSEQGDAPASLFGLTAGSGSRLNVPINTTTVGSGTNRIVNIGATITFGAAGGSMSFYFHN